MKPGRNQRKKPLHRAAPSGAQQRTPAAPAADRRALTAAVLTVILGAVLVHSQTLTFGFTNWDDDINVTQNPYVNPPSWPGVVHHWVHAYRNLYVPLVYTTFALDGLVGGGQPWAFHLSNVILHAAASVAVLLLVHRLLMSLKNPGASASDTYGAATMAALLFAVHPVQVEPVSWVTGRKDVLSGCLALWAAWFCLRSAEDARTHAQRWWTKPAVAPYAIGLLLFVLSLTAKPSAVALPAGLLVILWYVHRMPVREAALCLAPWFAVAAVWAVITALTQPGHPVLSAASPIHKRPLIAADAVCFYLKTIVWPVGLAPVYGRTPETVTANLGTSAAAGGLVAALGVAFAYRNIWSAAGLFALIMLLPVLGFTPFLFQNFSTVADRYLYLSLLGIAISVGSTLLLAMRLPRGARLAVFSLSGCALILAAALSVRQARIWHDSFALWEHNIRLYPQAASAYHNLANAHVLAGRDDPAYSLFQKALELDPDFGESQNNLGLIEGRRARHEQAVERYRAALAAYERLNLRDTRVFEARVNMSVSLLALGRLDEAESQLRAALDMHPDSWQALTNMALVLAAKGNVPAAQRHLQEALDYSPGNPQILRELQRLKASGISP